ncbi:hypothetical protein [Pseudoalteromonas sp. MMG024]|uniref:hypothetical protein n=1 Tax=Pseudoalteromonas sp. MMG024 TaxID=2909980 RepID=UPI001F1A6634|nr:hypothetical protein [Pseudoalteromonas sp. MMG024]MCF6459132.1 hypothetical protein [Pseudoalteromonas sp. MMG024]
MTIKINNTEITALAQLPNRIQTLLTFTQGDKGFDALASNKDEVFEFASFDAFAEQLPQGFRNSSLILVAPIQLVADVKKLLEFSANDLRDLAVCKNAQQAKPLLTKYQLLNNADFELVNQFCKQNGLFTQPIMAAAQFSEHIVLQNVLTYCDKVFSPTTTQLKAAVNWALGAAQNLSEFAHYYCLYLAWQNSDPGKNQRIDDVVAQLTDVVKDYFQCPKVTYELDAQMLNAAIIQWHAKGNLLGFTSISSAILSTALHIKLADSSTVAEQANTYLTSVQNELASKLANDSFIEQAGTARSYVFDLDSSQAIINIDPIGCMSIASIRPNYPIVNSAK